MNIREKLYHLIYYTDTTGDGEKNADIYDIFMMIVIAISLLPLIFKNETPLLIAIEVATVLVFLFDYAMRWFTSDIRLNKGALSFLIYPFTFMAIIDLLSTLPSLPLLIPGMNILRSFRAAKVLRVFRAGKILRYSKSAIMIMNVFKKQKRPLLTVCTLSIGYILVSAMVIYNVEPDSFETFFDAVYWATISLTTVGYGDLYPVTSIGRFIAMASSIFGIAIVALPAGIVTAGYLDELQKEKNQNNQ